MNPPASPSQDATAAALGDSARFEQLRRSHFGHEESVRSIFLLYFLTGIMAIGISVVMLIDQGAGSSQRVFGVTLLLHLAVLYFWVGQGLRDLQPWSRIPAALLSLIGLLWFPIGSIVNCYLMYLLISPKGAMVFSPQYAEAIARTASLRIRTHWIVWVLLPPVFALLLLVLHTIIS